MLLLPVPHPPVPLLPVGTPVSFFPLSSPIPNSRLSVENKVFPVIFFSAFLGFPIHFLLAMESLIIHEAKKQTRAPRGIFNEE